MPCLLAGVGRIMAGDSSRKKLLKGIFNKDSTLFAQLIQNERTSTLIQIIDVVSSQKLPKIDLEKSVVVSMCFAKFSANPPVSTADMKKKKRTVAVTTEDCLVAGLADGSLLCLSKSGDIIAKKFSAHKSQINGLDFDEEHSVLYSAGHDGFLRQWSIGCDDNSSQTTFQDNLEWNINSNPIYQIMLLDSKTMLIGQYKILLWDLIGAKINSEFNGHATGISRIMNLQLFGDQKGSFFATLGENDKSAQIWELGQESPKFILSLPGEPAVCFSSCGDNRIAVQSPSKLYLFEMISNSKKKITSLRPHDSIEGKHDILTFLNGQLLFLDEDGKFENVLKDQAAVASAAVVEKGEEIKVKVKASKKAKLTTGQALVVEPTDPSNVKEELPAPTEQSLVTVLSQALTSMDKDLLEESLKVIDLTIIKNTILALDHKHLYNLLRYLKEKLILKPNRINELRHWLIAVLNLRNDRLKSSKECLEEIEEILQFSSIQAQMLPKLLEMRQIALLKAADNTDQKLKMTSSNVLLMYDEETGNNELVQKARSNIKYATIPDVQAEGEISDDSDAISRSEHGKY